MRYSGIALLFGAAFAGCAFFLLAGWRPRLAAERNADRSAREWWGLDGSAVSALNDAQKEQHHVQSDHCRTCAKAG